MGREELIAHPEYKDHQSRYKLVDQVDAMVGGWTSTQKRDDLVGFSSPTTSPAPRCVKSTKSPPTPNLPSAM